MHAQFVEYPPDFFGRQGFQVFRRQNRFFPGLLFDQTTYRLPSGVLAGELTRGGAPGRLSSLFIMDRIHLKVARRMSKIFVKLQKGHLLSLKTDDILYEIEHYLVNINIICRRGDAADQSMELTYAVT